MNVTNLKHYQHYKKKIFIQQNIPYVDNIRIDDAASASAAVIAYEMGGYDNTPVRAAQVYAGAGLGRWFRLPSLSKSKTKEICVTFNSTNLIEYFSSAVLVTLFLYIEISTYLYGDSEINLILAILMFLVPGSILGLAIIIFQIKGHKNPHELVLYRFLAQIIELTILFPDFPTYLYVSDGGHAENYGLLPLIRRKCRLIIITDGSQDIEGTCLNFLNGLKLAEDRLHCSFLSDSDNESLNNYFQIQFISNINRKRFAHFKVRYNDGSFGEVVYLKAKSDGKNWNGMCCDCCKSCSFWSCCLGKFPQHSSVNQFFSPGLYRMYQDEGYAAYEEYRDWKANNKV